ncbi:hypothetical protein A6K76_15555 [Caryophanon latum]|uniref:Uncharacterized protein n=1 Tax=Caryophanon latum TaxID=33977 RepID=A0A1C0YB72_9BACL|nr:hypothetical protein A6K76_15555 [Caryophanon latum]
MDHPSFFSETICTSDEISKRCIPSLPKDKLFFSSKIKVVHFSQSGPFLRELFITTFFFKIAQSLVALRKKVPQKNGPFSLRESPFVIFRFCIIEKSNVRRCFFDEFIYKFVSTITA